MRTGAKSSSNNLVDQYLPSISSYPVNVSLSTPRFISYYYISSNVDVVDTIAVPSRMLIESITMASIMRWKGGNTVGYNPPPTMTLAFGEQRNVVLRQVFPSDSSIGAVPATEATSSFVPVVQSLRFDMIPFIVEPNRSFIFWTSLAYYQAILQADFTCNVTISGRTINL
jgi:hypothetical protein